MWKCIFRSTLHCLPVIVIHTWMWDRVFPRHTHFRIQEINFSFVWYIFLYFLEITKLVSETLKCVIWICTGAERSYSKVQPFSDTFPLRFLYKNHFSLGMKYQVMFYNVEFFIPYITDHYFSLFLASSLPSLSMNLQFTGFFFHRREEFWSSKHRLADEKAQE